MKGKFAVNGGGEAKLGLIKKLVINVKRLLGRPFNVFFRKNVF